MKLSISLSMAALTLVFIFSCKKEKSDPVPVPVPPAANPLTDSLAACYKFDGNYNDSTGLNTAGIGSGSLSFAAGHKGTANTAVAFGTNTKILLNGIVIAHPNQVTMSYWVNSPANASLQYYILSPLGPSAGQDVNNHYGVVSTPATNSVTQTVTPNNWHHMAITYNGSDIRYYVDGLLAGTVNHPGNITPSVFNYTLGYFNGDYWQGMLDDLRIYKTVLPDSVILQLSKL